MRIHQTIGALLLVSATACVDADVGEPGDGVDLQEGSAQVEAPIVEDEPGLPSSVTSEAEEAAIGRVCVYEAPNKKGRASCFYQRGSCYSRGISRGDYCGSLGCARDYTASSYWAVSGGTTFHFDIQWIDEVHWVTRYDWVGPTKTSVSWNLYGTAVGDNRANLITVCPGR